MSRSSDKPSAAFASRELNGEVLLEALNVLRESQVQTRHLFDLSQALEQLAGLPAPQAQAQLRSWAQGRFSEPGALGAFLSRWASKLKVDADVGVLTLHIRRTLLVGATLNGLRKASVRVPLKVPV